MSKKLLLKQYTDTSLKIWSKETVIISNVTKTTSEAVF